MGPAVQFLVSFRGICMYIHCVEYTRRPRLCSQACSPMSSQLPRYARDEQHFSPDRLEDFGHHFSLCPLSWSIAWNACFEVCTIPGQTAYKVLGIASSLSPSHQTATQSCLYCSCLVSLPFLSELIAHCVKVPAAIEG